MDLLIAANSVPLASADTVPATGTPQYATDGNPASGIPATDAPAYHYNMVIAELVNLVKAAGLTPSGSNWNQVEEAVLAVTTGRLVAVTSVTASETFTPNAATNTIIAEAQGSGGGAASLPATGSSQFVCSSGAAAGGFQRALISNVKGSTFPITIGAGGTSPPAGSAGNGYVGGTTTVYRSVGSTETQCLSVGGGEGSVGSGLLASTAFWTGSQAIGGTTSTGPTDGATVLLDNYHGSNGPNGIFASGANAPGLGASSANGAGGTNSNAGGGGSGLGFGSGAGGGGLGPNEAAINGGSGGSGRVLIFEFT